MKHITNMRCPNLYLYRIMWQKDILDLRYNLYRPVLLLTYSNSFVQLKLLSWQERPLLNVSQTNLLLNKLQELSMARLRPDFIEADLPKQALSSVRLALATNLGRAILEE